MRKSQAPSFRSTSKIRNDNEKEKIRPNGVVRSTDEILNILRGGCIDSERIDDWAKDLSLDVKEDETETVRLRENFSYQVETKNLNPGELSEELRVFNVVYCKQSTRKHKVWEGDGTLEVGVKFITLKDDKGKVLGTSGLSKSKTIEEGTHLFVGSKEVEVIESVKKYYKTTKEEVSPVKQTIKKRKIGTLGKKFVVPVANSLDKNKSGVILPEPSGEHQWYFNENNLPITQVSIEEHLARNLRQHQVVGVTFLYECIMGFKSTDLTGAILADEMGLGKTLQTIALIWTLLKQGPYGNKPVLKKVLIVTPSSLTMNWHNEFIKWLGRERLLPYIADSKKKPQDMRGPVMIISYEMFVRYYEEIKDISFDLLVCDEGHRLKNGNIRTTQLLQQLNCPRRILLTGTPIQNDLKEFYSLVDFVNPNALGTPAEFRRCFEEPILTSRQPHVDEELKIKGEESAADLKLKTSLFLLRRTKDILDNYLPTKSESVVFCKMTEVQLEIYNYLINSLIENNENLLNPSNGFFHFGIIVNLKKVCNHPALLWRKDSEDSDEDALLSRIREKFTNVKGNFRAESSGKLSVVLNFLSELKQRFPKERVVIVSNTTQTLDILEKLINELGHSTCRLDGSVPVAHRARIVESFNRQYTSTFVFLLSSKAGGVGLNLTGASRLILYDSDWNPATDLQAMSRIWRDGQKNSVYIYRLLTTGTIEEKIYQRQINKQGLCDGIVDPRKNNSIKLSEEEVKDIFAYCSVQDDCLTHDALSCTCSKKGEIPLVEEEEEEERSCQLTRHSKSVLKMNELLRWEHHGTPVDPSLLSDLCLSASERIVTFIFRNVKKT